jgi:cleavage stimulation factor subunit 2
VNSSHAVYTVPLQAVGPSGPSGSYSAGSVSLQQPGNEEQVQTIYNRFLRICYFQPV